MKIQNWENFYIKIVLPALISFFSRADGLTYEEAIKNVELVIQEWIETAESLDRPIPEPSGRLQFA